MTLGTARPRNWGKEAQQARLALLEKNRNVTFRTKALRDSVEGQRRVLLQLAPAKDGIVLNFASFAELTNTARGRWESRAISDDTLIATGISQCDVIGNTIDVLWR